MSTSETTTFLQAADMLTGFCAQIKDDQWGCGGLGEWDVRALVGHTLRAVSTVPTYLSQTRPDVIVCDSPAEYFVLARTMPGADDRSVADRGHQAGRDLGDDPHATIRREVARARAALDAVGDEDAVITTVVGGMRLGAYLPTRTFELLAHTLDLATATGIGLDPPGAVVESSLRTAVVAAALTGDGVALFRHLLGRPGGAHSALFA